MTSPLLTPEQKYQLYLRVKIAGETAAAVAREYGCSERYAQRCVSTIAKMTDDARKAFAEDAGLSEDYKIRVRCKAPSSKITMEEALRLWVYDPPVAVDLPKTTESDYRIGKLVAPLGELMEPKGTILCRGSRTNAGDGSVIIHDSEGNIVRVDRCPVSNPKFGERFATRETVDVTEINGIDVSGLMISRCGEKIPGKLYFYGLGKVVSFVRFLPDRMTKQYDKDDAEIRERMN